MHPEAGLLQPILLEGRGVGVLFHLLLDLGGLELADQGVDGDLVRGRLHRSGQPPNAMLPLQHGGLALRLHREGAEQRRRRGPAIGALLRSAEQEEMLAPFLPDLLDSIGARHAIIGVEPQATRDPDQRPQQGEGLRRLAHLLRLTSQTASPTPRSDTGSMSIAMKRIFAIRSLSMSMVEMSRSGGRMVILLI